jgi:hypothetical protein
VWHESDEAHEYAVDLVFDLDVVFAECFAFWMEAEIGKAQVSGFILDQIVNHERCSSACQQNIPQVRSPLSWVFDPSII